MNVPKFTHTLTVHGTLFIAINKKSVEITLRTFIFYKAIPLSVVPTLFTLTHDFLIYIWVVFIAILGHM